MAQSKKNRIKRLEDTKSSRHSTLNERYEHITDEELDEWYQDFIKELKNRPPDPVFDGMTSNEVYNYYFTTCI